MNRSIAEQIANAKANRSGNIIRDGRYLFEVVAVTADKKFKGNMFIAELKVLEAIKTHAAIEPNSVGSTVSYIVNLDDKMGLGIGNAKSFLMGLFGVSEEEISVDVICEVASEKQPAKGMHIRDEAFSKPKQSKPTESFTHHRWEHVTEKK